MSTRKRIASPEESERMSDIMTGFFKEIATPRRIANIYGMTMGNIFSYTLRHTTLAQRDLDGSVYMLWSIVEQIWGTRPDRFTIFNDTEEYWLYEVEPEHQTVIREIGKYKSEEDAFGVAFDHGVRRRFLTQIRVLT